MIPLATTLVDVVRSATDGDPYEAAGTDEVTSCVAGHISSPTAIDQRVGGAKETVDAVLYVGPGEDLARADVVTDRSTGLVWRVLWTDPRVGLGLDHLVCGLVRVEGGANG